MECAGFEQPRLAELTLFCPATKTCKNKIFHRAVHRADNWAFRTEQESHNALGHPPPSCRGCLISGYCSYLLLCFLVFLALSLSLTLPLFLPLSVTTFTLAQSCCFCIWTTEAVTGVQPCPLPLGQHSPPQVIGVLFLLSTSVTTS